MHLSELRARAVEDAAAAARGSGVDIVEVEEIDGFVDIARLVDEIWQAPELPMVTPDLLRALSFAGSYVAGARSGDRLVGVGIGFIGSDEGEPFLHSHIVGVSADVRSRHIGFAIKQHQRAWALERGLYTVTWTFDPLVRRNASFNIHRLQATATEYLENHYGPMQDGINAGEESDRLMARWDVASRAAVEAASRRPELPSAAELIDAGAVVVLSAGARGPEVRDVEGPVMLYGLPEDIVALRTSDPAQARAWRYALRDTLGKALSRGFRVTGFDPDGWYVVEPSGA